MTVCRKRLFGVLVAMAVALSSTGALSALPSTEGAETETTYTVTVGSKGSWTRPDDTPAGTYIDKDGTFWFQQAHALYGATEKREWKFYTGRDFDTATPATSVNNAADPENPKHSNRDTTWRCNHSPTGLKSTEAPAPSPYSQRNYCDLVGVWVDPDTGDWHGLVHNEFTPQPFKDGVHYDGIDYAVSKNQGRTWTIKDHVLTSPYSTEREDTSAFPHQTYHYGVGDPRLYVDAASGYFYAFYGSRIVNKGGGWKAFHAHVARAPLSGKMAPGTWQKWYDGSWSEPGVGGRESNMVPVDKAGGTGYTDVADEYDPQNQGDVEEQVEQGKMPPTSPLFVMDITYNAHLGLYIGQPQAVDQSKNAPQQYYATDNLATQKWFLLGDTGKYTNASWYRWFLDDVNKTSSAIVGKSFRSYCSFGCSGKSSSEYINLTIDSSSPAAPVDTSKAYRITSADDRVLSQVPGSSSTTSVEADAADADTWTFTSNGDGSYRITNTGSRMLLGVASGAPATRAWGTKPTVTAGRAQGPSVGQQWFVMPNTSPQTGGPSGTFRIVNRYSGLVIGLSDSPGRFSETIPVRHWTDSTGNDVGGKRTAGEQALRLIPAGKATAETPASPGSCTAPPWDRNATYRGGEVVSLKGREWKAKWWPNVGDEPGTAGRYQQYRRLEEAVWKDLGAC